MRKTTYFLFAIFFLASCGKEENEPPVENRMDISSCYVVSNNIQSENFSSPIGLYILSEDNTPYDDGLYYASLVSGTWSINAPVYVTKKGLVYAYYPYRSDYELPLMAVNMSDQVDILYSKTSSAIAQGSSSLSIRLYHALSQLTVSVENEEVSGISLQSPITGKFDICSGGFSELVSGDVAASSGKLLIVPHSSTAEIKISLKDGKEYTYSVSGMSFVAGENYTYQFKLNANREKLEITSFTIEDWINDKVHNDYL